MNFLIYLQLYWNMYHSHINAFWLKQKTTLEKFAQIFCAHVWTNKSHTKIVKMLSGNKHPK